jgi:fibulin 1/2
MQVSSNGLISFDYPFIEHQLQLFPITENVSVVAPFWSYVNTGSGLGNIYYHVYADIRSPLLLHANKDLSLTTDNFNSTWVLVVTYDGVPQFGGSLTHLNTYQVALAWNGSHSYAIFNYEHDGLQWSDNAVIGYMSADQQFFYNHPLSQTDSVVNVSTSEAASNTGVVGKLIYPLNLFQIAVSSNTSCNFQSCRNLTIPDNGKKNSSETVCGSTIKFSCNECYELKGDKQLSCLPNQTWSGEEPSCVLKVCPDLIEPTNGKKNSSDAACGSLVDLSCNKGFQLTGPAHVQCQPDGTWDNSGVGCEDVDECLLSPCENGGSCYNTLGSFACTCTAFFMGLKCEIFAGNVYSYGVSQSDTSLPPLDDYSHGPITIPLKCFPFGRGRHRSVYISTNGLISFDGPYHSPSPRLFPGFTYISVVAPFWSDVDIRRNGSVFYNVYTNMNSSYMQRATNDVRELSQDDSYVSEWVLVVTWYQVPNYPHGSPFASYDLSSKYNTFQLVLTSNGMQTFALFNYPRDSLKWSGRTWKAVVGYTSYDGNFFQSHYLSGYPEVVNIASQHADSGSRLFYQLSNNDSVCVSSSSCLSWYFNDIKQEELSLAWNFFLPPCPCTLFQVQWDFQYQWQSAIETSVCYVSVFESVNGAQTECCYSSTVGSLLIGPSQGGTANRYHTSVYPVLHYLLDEVPYVDCCVKMDACHLYYERRPSQTCFGYSPPFWGWIWGDPHISTLDGKQYTFNGIGEYILMKTVNETFVLEGRTRLLENSSATVFSAFAVAQFEPSVGFTQSHLQSSIIHAELMSNNTLRIMACCFSEEEEENNLVFSASMLNAGSWRDITVEFSELDSRSHFTLDNVILMRPNNKTLVGTFSSGISVTVEIKKGLLTVVFAAPETFKGQTRGLMGVWDDDLSNDFTARNEAVLHINSTDRQIHHLCQTWQVTYEESLFFYPSGSDVSTFSNPDHLPDFPDEVLDRYSIDQRLACNNDPVCLFDLFETNDPEVGQESLTTNVQLLEQSVVLAEFPPLINGSDVLNGTVGQTTTFTFVASDSDSFHVTVDGILPPAADYMLTRNGDEFTFTWTPTSSAIVSLVFIANDSMGLSSQLHPLVRLCACHLEKNASCTLSESDGGTDRFVLEDCLCGSGWEGRLCSVDFDACLMATCPGANCTDQAAPDTGYDCSVCSDGFEQIDGKCEDINECSNDSLHNCSQVCVNQQPFFNCECYAGFALEDNGYDCADVDECGHGVPCHQICNNVPGTFWCSCNNGFQLDTDNFTCIPEELCTIRTGDCEHVCYRNSSTWVESCSCHHGYQLDSNNVNCSDIDECNELLNGCDQTCVNTMGSFFCLCSQGYQLLSDKHSCLDINECIERPGLCNITGQVCRNLEGSYDCLCPLGTEVINGACKLSDDCASSPCLNGAQCHDGVGMFFCSCSSGYMGTLCDEEVNECMSYPCQNNATCTDLVDKFRCNCVDGYEGVSCEIDIDDCASNPCQHNGVCSDLTNGFVCTCDDGFYGTLCEIETNTTVPCLMSDCVGFVYCAESVFPCPHSYFTMFLQPFCQLQNSTTTSVSWASAASSCLMEQAREYFRLRLNDTGLLSQSKCDDFHQFMFLSQQSCLNKSLCNNNISSVDGALVSTVFDKSGPFREENIQQMLSLIDSCHTEGLDTIKDSLNSAVDECLSFPCHNYGSCMDGESQYTCVCVEGYIGLRCETDVDECSSNPCTDNQTCVNGVNQYICDCPTGYTGINCQTEIGDCFGNPCLNNGTCIDGKNNYTCYCLSGFTGMHCEINVDECSSNPCENNGLCVDGIDEYKCQCSVGFTGLVCEDMTDHCVSVTCGSYGTCINGVNGYRCDCIDGFTGNQCDINVDECASGPCMNDDLCEDGINRYICKCGNGFEGPDCDVGSSDNSGLSASEETALIVTVSGTLVVAVLLVLGIILYKKKRLSRVDPHQDHSCDTS